MIESQSPQVSESGENQSYHATGQWEQSVEKLQRQAYLTPQPLTSETPVVGGVIAWFRNAWNSVSTRWYVAPLVQQQNEFNQSVVDELRTIKGDIQSLRSELHTLAVAQQNMRQLLDEISDRLIANDRDVIALTHDLGKVTYAVIRLDEDLKRLDDTIPG